jgi:hypothetical protein
MIDLSRHDLDQDAIQITLMSRHEMWDSLKQKRIELKEMVFVPIVEFTQILIFRFK